MKIAEMDVTLINHCGDDLSVVNAARVSFDKESSWEADESGWENISLKKEDTKLIKYLADHKHFSPFNHAFLSFRVKAPIFVARQLVKHKFLPWNEISRRYVDSEPEFFFPDIWRGKAENVKQGSSDVAIDTVADNLAFPVNEALKAYEHALRHGVCPEQARMVLPQNTMTEWIWSGTLGAFLDMLVLRLDPHTQKETQEIAKKIASHVKPLFPESFKARVGEYDV